MLTRAEMTINTKKTELCIVLHRKRPVVTYDVGPVAVEMAKSQGLPRVEVEVYESFLI